MYIFFIFFFKQKTAYEMRISDWSSDVCSSDLRSRLSETEGAAARRSIRFTLPGLVRGTGDRRAAARHRIFHRAQSARCRGNRENAPFSVRHLREYRTDRLRSEERRVGKECVSSGSTRCEQSI